MMTQLQQDDDPTSTKETLNDFDANVSTWANMELTDLRSWILQEVQIGQPRTMLSFYKERPADEPIRTKEIQDEIGSSWPYRCQRCPHTATVPLELQQQLQQHIMSAHLGSSAVASANWAFRTSVRAIKAWIQPSTCWCRSKSKFK